MLLHRSCLAFFIVVSVFFSAVADDCLSVGKRKFAYTVVVDKDSKQFPTVQSAINTIPDGNNKWSHIILEGGNYTEKVMIKATQPCIVLECRKYKSCVVQWDEHEAINVSATFTSRADNIVVKNVIFKNTYNHLLPGNGNERKPAPAATIAGDKTAFYGCSFYGVQDTLFDAENRHFFKSCLIEGSVDFIFGRAQSIYEDCRISVIAGDLLLHPGKDGTIGYITAQGRSDPNDTNGFVFKRGVVYGTGQAYLGRAWERYSRVIFARTKLKKVVYPAGWWPWDQANYTQDITYAEAKCRGPGAKKSGRVSWEKNLSSEELSSFTSISFIDQEGWLQKQP